MKSVGVSGVVLQARDSLRADSVAIAATILSVVLSRLVDEVNLVLLALFALFAIIDHLVGMGRAYLDQPVGWWDRSKFMRGTIRKLLLVSLVLVAAGMDLAFSYVPGFGPPASQLTLLTKMTLGMLLAGQWGSILKNVRRAIGPNPAAALLMRQLDAANLGEEPPRRRSYDKTAPQVPDKS